ncbi:alpha/beta fold hydrolase [Salipiger thiooxidans]|jgi:pimeloyl-ACP methyl ester carboxylesterase|uniref:alpha/beta fold hydrolase n=1 Tax=Salipiger thiooxidans TaxID=282683 RepID=UPI001A8F41A1|nr:alpha/beta fold hydrolase [Salipiger thiooxidans]MBN8187320.1 alpha/beta fold hydrolase [Salipiger thiooxidans]MBR9837874.1 alpha/beta fold hydrolase [Paracoccaceae bacterium]MCA0847470.1 alpha/beta hydrolase [Salipiger thiooxidans]
MAEPLVLLPDLMCDARLFGPQIADLSREMAVTVAPVSSGERVEEVASALLDVLPRRFALVGLGLGGMVAMELQRRAPDRVARLMLISTTPLAETPQQAAELDPLIIKARTGRLREAVRALRPVDCLAPGPFRMEIQAMLDEMAEGLGVDVFTRQIRVLQRRRDQQSALRKLRVPVTVLCGAHDITLPVKRHAFLAELIPGARLEVIEDAGHLPPLEAPDAVSDAIRDWLQAPMLAR